MEKAANPSVSGTARFASYEAFITQFANEPDNEQRMRADSPPSGDPSGLSITSDADDMEASPRSYRDERALLTAREETAQIIDACCDLMNVPTPTHAKSIAMPRDAFLNAPARGNLDSHPCLITPDATPFHLSRQPTKAEFTKQFVCAVMRVASGSWQRCASTDRDLSQMCHRTH